MADDLQLAWDEIEINGLVEADYDASEVIEAIRVVHLAPISEAREVGIRVSARRGERVLAGGLGAEFRPDLSARLLIQVLVAAPASQEEPAISPETQGGLSAYLARRVLESARSTPEIEKLGGGVLRFDRAVVLPTGQAPQLFEWMAGAVVRLLLPGSTELPESELAALLGVTFGDRAAAGTSPPPPVEAAPPAAEAVAVAETPSQDAPPETAPPPEQEEKETAGEEGQQPHTLSDLLQREGSEFVEKPPAEPAPLPESPPIVEDEKPEVARPCSPAPAEVPPAEASPVRPAEPPPPEDDTTQVLPAVRRPVKPMIEPAARAPESAPSQEAAEGGADQGEMETGRSADGLPLLYPPPSRTLASGESRLTLYLCAACNHYAAREVAPRQFKCYRCQAMIKYR